MIRWSEIEGRLELYCPTGVDKRPDEADVDRYEAESGVKLPDDYRRFTLAYGPGSIAASHEFEFAAAGIPEAGVYGDLATFNPPGGTSAKFQGYSDEDLSRTYGRDPAWLRRLVFFCFVRDVGDQFAWDPSEVTDPAEHEMAIYLCGGDVRVGLWRVAATFGEFVIDYLLKGRYGRECVTEYREDVDSWDEGEAITFDQKPWVVATPPKPKKKG